MDVPFIYFIAQKAYDAIQEIAMKKKISRREFMKSSAKAGLLIGLAGSSFLRGSTNDPFDVVIKNGTLADGVKNETYRGDIGIVGERIISIGDLRGAKGKMIIDAANRIVSPGFIDIHTHTDVEILVNRIRAELIFYLLNCRLASETFSLYNFFSNSTLFLFTPRSL